MLRWLKSKHKTKQNVLVMPLKYTPVTQSTMSMLFFMYVATTLRLNYSGQESKKQFAILWFWHTCALETKVKVTKNGMDW